MKTHSALCIGLSLSIAGAAQAAVVAEDSFTYTDGDLEGLNGGTGFSGAWAAATNGGADQEFDVVSNAAIYQGSSQGQNIVRQSRPLASAVTVNTTEIVTIDLDIILNETQAGRGMGVNLTSGGAIVMTLGKRINANVGLHASGLGTASTQLINLSSAAAATGDLTATLSYDGTDTLLSLTDGTNTGTHTFTGTQISFDAVELTGYHQSTTSNGIDAVSIDVSPVPEPASAALLGLGTLLIARRRR